MYKLNKNGGISIIDENENIIKNISQLETIYYHAKKPLTKSDKFLIKLLRKRYDNLYKKLQVDQKSGKITEFMKKYPIRRRYYINMIDEICGNNE